MKKTLNIKIILIAISFIISSCGKEDLIQADVKDFNPDTYIKGPIDNWLEQEFLDPYNIEVVYRWKRELSPIAKEIVPPKEDRVQPAMEAVRDVWLKPYLEIAGPAFIKTLCPKQIVLYGSAEYNPNGTITLGTADGGRRIVLNVINTFDKSNGQGVKRMMRTIHHEFTHIINQIVSIPIDFQEITRGGYFSNWTTETDEEALALGYVSQYARMNPTEDFAEMVAHLLVEGQFWFDSRVASAPTEEAASELRQKEQAVVDYFYLNFDIDFRELQQRVAQALDQVTPPVPFALTIIDHNISNLMQISPKEKTVKSGDFSAIWDQAIAEVAAIDDRGRILNDMQLMFGAGEELTVRFSYISGGNPFLADYAYNIHVVEDGTTTFEPVPPRGEEGSWGNANIIGPGVAPVLDYLENHTFKADWITHLIPGSRGVLAGFFKVDDADSYFYGRVQ